MEVKNKKIILTGAGSGIGRELAIQLVAEGAYVLGLDISEKTLKETKELIKSDRFKTYQLDMAKKSEIEKFYKEYYKIFDELDILINNAGIIQPFVHVSELDDKVIDHIMQVNFFGPLNLIRLFINDLKKRPASYIVNVSSMGGFFPFPGQTVYGASKAALKLLTEGLYAELLDTNVKVSIIYPGAIATNISENSKVTAAKTESKESSFKAMPAEDAAREIIEGIYKEKLQVYVGSDSKFMNKFYKLSPQKAIKFIANKMKNM